MNKTLARLFMTGSLSAALVCAQGPGPGPMDGAPPDAASRVRMHVELLTSRLNLTETQQTKATALLTEAQTAGETIQTNLESARQSIAAAVKKNDTAEIDRLAAQAGTLSGQLLAADAKAQAALYAILTADQRSQYDSMPRGGPGAGGPGRFGPPPGGGPPQN